MERIGAGALALSLGMAMAGSSVQAQTADMTRATCGQLLDLPRNDRGQLMVWLHGYYAGAAQRATLDRTKLEDAAAAIQGLCERNRALPLIGSEARALFLGEAAAAPAPAPSPSPPAADKPAPARPEGLQAPAR